MNKHTKGEWHIGGHNKCTIYDQYGQRIANSFEGVLVVQRGDDECAANARLIAAAPVMFELLTALDKTRGSHFINNEASGMHGWDEKLYAALAKANGEFA